MQILGAKDKGPRSAVVVGSGVTGLTTALELATSGWQVHVLSREGPLQTTSVVASAIWWPYDPEPVDRSRHWARLTLETLRRLAAETPEAGVRTRNGTHRRLSETCSPWFEQLLEASGPATVQNGAVVSTELTVPIVDMPVYLSWLRSQCLHSGVSFEQRDLASLSDVSDTDLVVNCTGLGARSLVDDARLQPSRGQVVVMKGTGIEEFVKDETQHDVLTYIYPRMNTVVLGGTREATDDTVPADETTKSIIERCTALDKRVRAGEITSVLVGLRPVRDVIRVEVEQRGFKPVVVHNYGHGRAGVSLSWGCSAEVVALCDQVMRH